MLALRRCPPYPAPRAGQPDAAADHVAGRRGIVGHHQPGQPRERGGELVPQTLGELRFLLPPGLERADHDERLGVACGLESRRRHGVSFSGQDQTRIGFAMFLNARSPLSWKAMSSLPATLS